MHPVKTTLAFFIGCLTTLLAQGQITWAEDIAPMVYENCSHCHHEGQVAPFSIMSYEDVVENALSMYFAMEDGHMPPWPADPNYQEFVGQTIVTQDQIDGFLEWIESGLPYGNPALEPEPPVFVSGGTLLDHVDFVVEIPPYTLQSNSEEYRWFVIPTDFDEIVYVNGIECVAGLPEVVHHADIFYDMTGNSMAFDLADPLPGFNGSTGSPTNNYYMNAWQPGAGPAVYPENWGIPIPPGADLVIEIHYGPGAAEEVDETYMNLQFVQDPENVRPINVGWLLNTGNMTDGPLIIPANEEVTFHQQAVPWGTDKSLISICPHMHLLGKSYKVWMETPDNTTQPLIDIPQWNFHWQFYYTFPTIRKIPGGTVIKSEAVYDNTIYNELNPNNPPITVYNGAYTTDEMFLCYFIYANYQEGDEDIILDPDIVNSTDELTFETIELYPNPASQYVYMPSNGNRTAQVWVFDMSGREVAHEKLGAEGSMFRLDVSELSAGTYSVKLLKGGKLFSGTIVRSAD